MTSWISFAARHCFSGRMIGIAPATAASNKKSTPLSSAASRSSCPCVATRSLFAVTTFFPACRASRIIVLAGSMPPITSITISISSSLMISSHLSVKRDWSTPFLFLFMLCTSIFWILRPAPAFIAISSFWHSTSLYTPLPTVPSPKRPAFTTLS